MCIYVYVYIYDITCGPVPTISLKCRKDVTRCSSTGVVACDSDGIKEGRRDGSNGLRKRKERKEGTG
jgi:hypothetical protein